MFKKGRKSIGLEIGDGLVKVMSIGFTPKENKLLGFEMVAVNFREGRQGIVNAMAEVLKRLNLKKKDKINISVSGESVMVRDIHWPQMSDEEIRKALKFEVERQVHFKADEIVFDYYSVIDKSIADTKTRVVLVAAKKDLIENYSSLVESAGYKCGFVEVDTFSLLNCFYINGPEVPADKTVALINVGLEVTNIDIIKGKIVGLTKDAFVAWSNLVDALPEDVELDFNNVTALKGLMGTDDVYELSLFIMNALSNQVRRTIEFYESQGRDTVEEVFLSGRLAMYKNLDKYLQDILGLKVTIWDPIANISYNPKLFEKKKLKENAPMLALCAGLACRRCFNIDLSMGRKSRKQSKLLVLFNEHKVLVFVAIIVFSFLLGIWIILLSQLKMREMRKHALLAQNKKLNDIIQEIENLKQGRIALGEHMHVAQALLSQRLLWSRILYEISKSMPGNLWLEEIYIKEGVTDGKSGPSPVKIGELADLATKTARPGYTAPQTILYIKGVAYSQQSEKMLSIINDFTTNLKLDDEFSKNFQNIELKKSYREMVGDDEVMKFRIECNLKTGN